MELKLANQISSASGKVQLLSVVIKHQRMQRHCQMGSAPIFYLDNLTEEFLYDLFMCKSIICRVGQCTYI